MDKDNSSNSGNFIERCSAFAAEERDPLSSLLAENELLRSKIVEIMLHCQEIRERRQNPSGSCH